MAKKQKIQIPVNAALQANITPIGLEFERNALILGENYCRIQQAINHCLRRSIRFTERNPH